MDRKIKIELMRSVDSIKNKIRQMKNQEHEINLSFGKILKPVTEPLQALVAAKNKSCNIKQDKYSSFLDSEGFHSVDDLVTANSSDNSLNDCDLSPKKLSADEIKDNYDTSLQKADILGIYDGVNIPFGLRTENKTLMVGNSIVSFSKNNVNNEEKMLIKIGDNTYLLTPGLRELLLRKKPDLNSITAEDKLVYKDILQYTNAHKRDFNAEGQIRGDKGVKYTTIIKPLFSENVKNIESKIQGGNLPLLKKYKSNTDLVYWDDPNEIVERLKLLIASRDAGNTNHDNEILSIIEELREANIIKE